MARILVIEDDTLLSMLVHDHLVAEKHEIDTADNGREGLEKLMKGQFDLLLLDWQLPEMDGVEILTQYRMSGGSTPVLMMTSRGSVNEIETGFDSGTDDYLPKPFDMRELSARVKALLRRTTQPTPESAVIRVGDLELNPQLHKLFKHGNEIKLLPKEFALIEFLMRQPEHVFSQRQLIDKVWSSVPDVSDDAVATCVRRLRNKIDDPDAPTLIVNVHGSGYKLRRT